GIRDFHVTGVQTCALPISGFDIKIALFAFVVPAEIKFWEVANTNFSTTPSGRRILENKTSFSWLIAPTLPKSASDLINVISDGKIGRASCRASMYMSLYGA